MARYIDADLLLAEIEDNTPLNFTDSESEVQAQFDFQVLKHMVGYQPTADVVPKSEVDLYKRQVDELEDELASTYDKLENTKAEVARKIFEALDRYLIPTQPPFVKMDYVYYLKLKEKYMEGETDA